MRTPFGRALILALAFALAPFQGPTEVSAAPSAFVNFETAPVHPVALGPDGRTLAVCNLPDGRVELFDVATGVPHNIGSIRVGVDPVSVRWRTSNELWVVNHISSSVNVVDVERRLVLASLPTKAGPADVVFAGTPSRAYVSCAREDVVQVFDPLSRQCVTNLAIKGDRPKAMAVSPDGTRVYVAIFESGNASTILAPPLTPLDVPQPSSVVSDPEGPHQGQDPPPNRGTGFHPPLAPYLDPRTLPRGSLIVKKDAAGRWLDDNQGDWTEFVSGSKAARSGRVPGWDMPDRDLAAIDTVTHTIAYATGLMNLCMAVAVNPADSSISVVGTDGINEVRFEPNLRGTFLRVNLARIDPTSLARTIHDLNPHLDYTKASIPIADRAHSLGDPRGLVWNSAGTRAYVTGMGSGNLVVMDREGQRVQTGAVDLGEGPTGLALDEARNRLYVLNRFAASLSVVDLGSLTVATNVSFFDPTPAFIKAGRRQFHDTRRTSGLGHVSCASCHPDGRFDRLAWDLGIPNGEMFNTAFSSLTNYFHPMKGPMVTRTLQDPVARDVSPSLMHWRGDRFSIIDFHITFPDLLGADQPPSVTEMRELEKFLSSITFPPNRFRTLNNELPVTLPLPGFFGLNPVSGPAAPLPPGNALRGLELFKRPGGSELDGRSELRRNSCAACHDCQSGKGIELFRINSPRSEGLDFTGAPLRGLDEKLGFNLQSTESRAGFGFFHDGRVDTLTRVLVDGFELRDNQEIADMTAFLLSFSGGELNNCAGDSTHIVPDAPAATGRQITLTTPVWSDALSELFGTASRSGEIWDHLRGATKPSEFVIQGRQGGVTRSWWRDFNGRLVSDRNDEPAELESIVALASPENPLTFTAVPFETGRRLAIDRDDDGVSDRTEAEQGSDPLDHRSPSTTPPPEGQDFYFHFTQLIYAGQRLDVAIDSGGRWRGSVFTPLHPNNVIRYEFVNPEEAPAGLSLGADGTRLLWDVPATQPPGCWQILLRANDNARPTSGYAELILCVRPGDPLEVRINPTPSQKPNPEDVELEWVTRIGHRRYEIHTSDSPAGPWRVSASVHETRWFDRSRALGRSQRFYRVVGVPD